MWKQKIKSPVGLDQNEEQTEQHCAGCLPGWASHTPHACLLLAFCSAGPSHTTQGGGCTALLLPTPPNSSPTALKAVHQAATL